MKTKPNPGNTLTPKISNIINTAVEVYCCVDDNLVIEPIKGKLSISELITIGILFAIKGCSFNRFYAWLKANLKTGFPKLPERSRLLRRLIAYRGIISDFLANASVFCIADSYGIELRHPIREFYTPKTQRIGEKSKSNHRWIHGMKLMLMINDEDKIVDFAVETANKHDQCFNKGLSRYENEAIILTDMGFRDKNGIPNCLKICKHKIWSERMSIERLFSRITRLFNAKKRNHRSIDGLISWISYLILGINLCPSMFSFVL